MSITYTTTINSMYCVQSPQPDYVVNVLFTVSGTDGTHTASSIQPYVSNKFTTTTGVYGTFASAITSTTSASATYPGTQLPNSSYTLQDVQNLQPGNQPTWFSQVVVTLAITGSSLGTPTTGQIGVTIRYVQNDMNIGNATTYPYGNFD